MTDPHNEYAMKKEPFRSSYSLFCFLRGLLHVALPVALIVVIVQLIAGLSVPYGIMSDRLEENRNNEAKQIALQQAVHAQELTAIAQAYQEKLKVLLLEKEGAEAGLAGARGALLGLQQAVADACGDFEAAYGRMVQDLKRADFVTSVTAMPQIGLRNQTAPLTEELVQSELGKLNEAIDKNKAALLASLSSLVNKDIAAADARLKELNELVAQKTAELESIEAGDLVEEKSVTLKRTVIDENVYGTDDIANVENIRASLPRDVSAVAGCMATGADDVRKCGEQLLEWMRTPREEEYSQSEKVTKPGELSPDQILLRDSLMMEIEQLQEEARALSSRLENLRGALSRLNESVCSNWEVDTCLAKLSGACKTLLGAQQSVSDLEAALQGVETRLSQLPQEEKAAVAKAEAAYERRVVELKNDAIENRNLIRDVYMDVAGGVLSCPCLYLMVPGLLLAFWVGLYAVDLLSVPIVLADSARALRQRYAPKAEAGSADGDKPAAED